MRRVQFAGAARNDLKRILRRGEAEFGATARGRYKVLLDQAVRDLAEDPGRNGVKPFHDVRRRHFVYHIKWSKGRVSGTPIGRPRHLLVFSIDEDGSIILAAVVHERELLGRHLES